MHQYHSLLQHIMEKGVTKTDRTGTGTIGVFGYQMRFDLSEGFPLVTTKKIYLRAVIHELLWFLKGETNTKYLNDNKVNIWDEWALTEDVVEKVDLTMGERIERRAEMLGITVQESIKLFNADNYMVERMGYQPSSTKLSKGRCSPEYANGGEKVLNDQGVPFTKTVILKKKGDLGPVYGKQWRSWVGPDGKVHDQISEVIRLLKESPDSRRIIVSAWNVGELSEMALMPCHVLFQFNTEPLTHKQRFDIVRERYPHHLHTDGVEASDEAELIHGFLDELNIPQYRLSCQLYQRKQHCALVA